MIGSDPEGRLGEAPRPELREHGRISAACFDAARGIIPGLKVLFRFLHHSTPIFIVLNKIFIYLHFFFSSLFYGYKQWARIMEIRKWKYFKF